VAARTGLALTVLAAAAAGAGCSSNPAPGRPAGGTVQLQLLAVNDLHGNLEPPGGARAGRPPVGGMAFLATHIARLEAAQPHTLIVSAGDNIGATPLVSALFHDEPTVEALNAIGLDYSAVGNHELDEGWSELLRMQRGGCHPRDGCQDGTPFRGAAFQFLAANVQVDPARADPAAFAESGWRARGGGPEPLFPPFAVHDVGGVKVGFVGITLRGAASLVNATAVRGLTFGAEADAANAAARELTRQGVRTIVVLMHEGADVSQGAADPCAALTGPAVEIASALSRDIDVVVSGHTHQEYVCTVGSALVTSAGSFGRALTAIELTIDRRTRDVVAKSARNIVVTGDVPPDAAQASLIERYAALARKDALRPVGAIAGPLSRSANEAGESPLGRLVADAMLEAARTEATGGADVAFCNPGGIRTDLARTDGGAGVVTFGELFAVLPYGNQLLVKTLTGDAILRLLEEQFDNPQPGRRTVLQASGTLRYAYRLSAPRGQRVVRSSVTIEGRAIDPAARYRVVMPDFLWNGGDRFAVPLEGTDSTPAVVDLDAVIAYLGRHQPAAAPGDPRITLLP